jgi:hypothetical protein
MATRTPIDRSLAFTALLELDPEGFGKSGPEGGQTITTFLKDWYASDAKDMYAYCKEWLAGRQEAAKGQTEAEPEQLREVGERYQLSGEAPSGWTAEGDPVYETSADPEPGDGPGDWRVTAQVHREADGWQSSRQVPAFTIPRWLAPTRGDAEAKAREIIAPYGGYEITMDVWAQDRPQAEPQVLLGDDEQLAGVGPGDDPRQDLQAVADYYEATAASDAEAWGRRGPSASSQEWLAEGQADPGPTERQLEDWAEHNATVDGLEAGQ